jgi:rod shape-determining protein MreD
MKPALYVLVFIALILAQTTLLEQATIVGIKPDLSLIVVYFWGLFGGEVRGVMAGLSLGYLMELMSGGIWGIHLVTKPALGFISGVLGRTLVNVSIVFTGVIIGFCSLIQGLIFLLVQTLTADPGNIAVFLSHVILPQALYDGVVGSSLFWLLSERFLPTRSTALGQLKNPALSALARGAAPPQTEEK